MKEILINSHQHSSLFHEIVEPLVWFHSSFDAVEKNVCLSFRNKFPHLHFEIVEDALIFDNDPIGISAIQLRVSGDDGDIVFFKLRWVR